MQLQLNLTNFRQKQKIIQINSLKKIIQTRKKKAPWKIFQSYRKISHDEVINLSLPRIHIGVLSRLQNIPTSRKMPSMFGTFQTRSLRFSRQMMMMMIMMIVLMILMMIIRHWITFGHCYHLMGRALEAFRTSAQTRIDFERQWSSCRLLYLFV